MKRFFVCFAVFAAMFFTVSCGGSSTTGDNTDTGTTETDEDSADSGSTDTGTTEPTDTGEPDTAPDNGDSTPDNDTDSGNTEPDYDNGNSTPDSDPSDPINENPDNLPECSPTSTTPCFDSGTGLIWSGKSAEKMHWADAVDYCKNLKEGGFDDWKIPHITLLKTLVQNCDNSNECEGNADGTYSKFGDIVFLWSSTGGNSEASGIYFFTGATQNKNVDENFNVRCIRSLKCEDQLYNPAAKKCVNPCNQNPCDSLSAITDAACTPFTYEEYSCSGKDPATELIWSARSENQIALGNATSYCSKLREGGYNDWRLPSRSVLETLIQNCDDRHCEYNNDGKYSKLGDSATLFSSDRGKGWCSCGGSSDFSDCIVFYQINFSVGDTTSFTIHCLPDGDYFVYVRCVRREGSEETRLVNCTGLPENAEWNTVSQITQTWDWDKSWFPSQTGSYSEEPSTEECRFKCKENYLWSSSSKKCLNSYDSTSGLIWSKETSYSETWPSAVNHCEYLNDGGHTDWRLPTISELRTLIQNCPATQMPPSGSDVCTVRSDEGNACLSSSCWTDPCNGCSSDSSGKYSKLGDSSRLWSSSAQSDNSDRAWYVDFYSGLVFSNSKSYTYSVRCVR